MNAHSMMHTMTGRHDLAAITAPTLVSRRAFMFAKRPPANMAVYRTNGTTRVRSIGPMTLAPNICMTTTTAALTASCAPDTTVGNGSAPTASLLMTSIVELQPLYARIQKSFSARLTGAEPAGP